MRQRCYPFSAMPTKKELLQTPIQHIDIKQHNVVALVDAMQHLAFSSRDLYRAASIYERMLRDTECGVILTLAGSMVSSGMKQIFIDLIRNHMVDAIVSTGANIVDQDFFEALGYKHWIADELYKQGTEDHTLRELMIDRIYDTLIDEEELRICDRITGEIADSLEPRPYSSREFIREMGVYLEREGKTLAKGGRRLRHPRSLRTRRPDLRPGVLRLLSRLRPGRASARPPGQTHGLHRLGQGFLRDHPAQDRQSHHRHLHARRRPSPKTSPRTSSSPPRSWASTLPCTSTRSRSRSPTCAMARSRPSTLKEASSWGKVDTTYEQMVFSEATLALPLIAGYAYHKQAHAARKGLRWSRVLEQPVLRLICWRNPARPR